MDEEPETGGCGLRPSRMKRALVLPEGGSGSSLAGLSEREEVVAWLLTSQWSVGEGQTFRIYVATWNDEE